MSNVVLRGKEAWKILWKDLTCIWIEVLSKTEGGGGYTGRAKSVENTREKKIPKENIEKINYIQRIDRRVAKFLKKINTRRQWNNTFHKLKEIHQ